MIKVKNKKVIASLSYKSLKANKIRNLIAITAIALTTILFTALFTIAGTITNSFQQESFRQGGGDFHGTFKYVTIEQIDLLSKDPLVVKSASRLMLGMPTDPPFNKSHVEISYMDHECVKGAFCAPDHGTLPQEGTNQVACDTRVLQLLGVEPKIGATLTLTYYLGSETDTPKKVTDSFTLSGWWNYDEAMSASNILVPLSYANQVLADYTSADSDNITGKWSMNVYLKSSVNIQDDLETILKHQGYQAEDAQADNYIAIGVNWAYVGAQFSQTADAGTILAMTGLIILIIFTGYLIIYNIFQISVTNDIRFYGLLKTIGTTGKQIRHLIYRQALLLSAVGIPIGLIIGYLCGHILSPIVMSILSYKNAITTTNPLIFLGASAFSLITVLISCRKPGKIAGKVSPIEAVRYTENIVGNKKFKRNLKGINMYHMALVNLGRNKNKTVLIVLSLSLAVVLLQVTVTFSNGFDMDKYLRHFVISDFIVSDANYFNPSTNHTINEETAVSESTINDINNQNNIIDSGRIYGISGYVNEFITEEWYRKIHGGYNDNETLNLMLQNEEHTANGKVTVGIHLYGMEAFPQSLLTVIDGDLAPLSDPTQNAIAAVYQTDDYNQVEADSHWAKVGDQMTLRYIDALEFYDIRTGEVVTDTDKVAPEYLNSRVSQYHEVNYTVAALVTIPYAEGYRYFGSDEFILNSEVFKRDTGTSNIMTYLFNTSKESTANMENFLANYTEKIDPTLDYESKQLYADEFESLRNIFLLMGGVLSGIVGLVGILNFLNGVLTSILTRRREFAMLQSIGMTGRQLKTMLVCEGVLYTLFAISVSLILSLITGPLLNKAISSMFWFFTYRFTILPILIVAPLFLLMGIALPLITYRFTAHQTIVERLREVE